MASTIFMTYALLVLYISIQNSLGKSKLKKCLSKLCGNGPKGKDSDTVPLRNGSKVKGPEPYNYQPWNPDAYSDTVPLNGYKSRNLETDIQGDLSALAARDNYRNKFLKLNSDSENDEPPISETTFEKWDPNAMPLKSILKNEKPSQNETESIPSKRVKFADDTVNKSADVEKSRISDRDIKNMDTLKKKHSELDDDSEKDEPPN